MHAYVRNSDFYGLGFEDLPVSIPYVSQLR